MPSVRSAHTKQIASSAAIRSVISMGILDEIPTDESSISVEEVASRKGMDSELVGTHFEDFPTLTS